MAYFQSLLQAKHFYSAKKFGHFKQTNLSKIVPSYIFVLLPNVFIKKKKNFICAPFCLRLIFLLRMHCWRKYSLIFSVPDNIYNMSKRTTFMGILVFPSKIFLELSNFLMLKTQLCQKAPFHAATVDISLIELCGLQIPKNWLFSVVVK